MAITLDSVICPGCAEELPKRNRGCMHCGYEDNDRGCLLPLRKLAQLPSFPDQAAARFNDVSPRFIATLIAAAQGSMAIHETAIKRCKHCGSNDLAWQTHSVVSGAAQDGRLKVGEVVCQFVFGCNHCSETLAVLSADRVADVMNASKNGTVSAA
ncbi:TPA: hypothetical protein ACRN02_006787 [Pseudomonas aeruginosa]